MRRRPTENESPQQTNVFSSDAWGTPGAVQSHYVTPEKEDLAQYAAALIPEGQTRTARTARYAPSANSAYYEPSTMHNTNSDQDPFSSAVLETRQQTTRHQNVSVSDMPQPVRRTRLGEAAQYATPPQATAAAPAPPAPQAPPSAPQNFAPPQAPAPQVPQHVSVQGIGQRPAPQTPAAAPIELAPEMHTAPAPPQAHTPAPTPADVAPEMEEEISLSDFEQEFIQAQASAPIVEEPVVEQAPVIEQIDLTAYDTPSVPQAYGAPTPAPTYGAPQLFSTGIAYKSSDDFFENMHENISDADRLYADNAPRRETVQLDLNFIKRHLGKLISMKIVIIAFALVLAATAFFVVRSMSSDNTSTPAPAETQSQNTTDKQVLTDPNGQPVITDGAGNQLPVGTDDQPIQPTTGSDAGGPTIYYDQNGQVIYSNDVSQNFNE